MFEDSRQELLESDEAILVGIKLVEHIVHLAKAQVFVKFFEPVLQIPRC